jgi:hypothetical protein
MLTPTDFASGYTAIPNIEANDVALRVQAFIDFFTWECLTEFFGFEISDRIAALETEDKEVVLTEAEDMLKYYVFSKWIQGNKVLTDNGTVIINSVVGSNVYDTKRVADVYNRSVELSKAFETYLVNRSDFSDVKCKAKRLLPFFNY